MKLEQRVKLLQKARMQLHLALPRGPSALTAGFATGTGGPCLALQACRPQAALLPLQGACEAWPQPFRTTLACTDRLPADGYLVC